MNNLTETLKKEQNAKNGCLEGQIYDKNLEELRSELEYYYACIEHLKTFTSSSFVEMDLMHVYKLVEKLEKSIMDLKSKK